MPKSGYKSVKWLFGKEIEIPEEWEIKNLKKLVEFHKQGLYTTIPYSEHGIKIARVNDLENGNLSYEKMMCLDVDDKTFKSFQISIGNFLIARTGTIGNYAIVKDDIPCMHISDIIRFVFNKHFLVNDFFGLFFESSLSLIQLLMIQQSSSHVHINAETIKSLKILLPTIEEQNKIVSILSSVDDLISSYDETIQTTKKLKQGLMQQLLTKGIGHKKFKKVPWLFGKEIEIPEEWDIKKLENVVDILDGKRVPLAEYEREKRQGSFPYYGASGVIDYIDDYIFDEKLLCLAEDGENLRSRVLPIAYTIEGKTWVNNHAHVLRAKIDHYFLEFFLNSLSFLKYVASTAQPKLNQKDMRLIPIICPTKSEQEKIAYILFNVDEKISELESKKKSLESLKKGLMQKLLTGQIRVSV